MIPFPMGGMWQCPKCHSYVPNGCTHSCPTQIINFPPAAPAVSYPVRAPVLCPVCEGKTRVPNDFYPVGAGESALSAEFVTCRSCSGRGIV